MSPKKRNWIVPVVLIALFFYMAVRIFSMNTAQPKVEYRTIIDYFKNEQVAEYELDFGTGELTMQLNDEKKTTITYSVPNLSLFLQDTHALVDEYNAEHPDAPIKQYYDAAEAMPWWIDMLPLLLTVLLMGGFWYILMKRSGGGGNPMAFAKLKPKQQDPHNRVTFDDVAGADEEKEELEEIVQFLKDPGKFNALGARIPKGVLLMGPPGTGKTLLAKAVAGEASVPFFSISGSDFVEMFVGVGASRVRDLFQQAAKVAPAIIFIDEIDAIGRTRDSKFGGNDEREQTLNQLLAEIDGFDSSKGVVILAATNRPEILDKALLRAGRFDRRIIVDRPNLAGRYQTLRVHTKNIKLAEDVDLHKIAQATAGAVGADLANLVNEAALRAVRLGRKAVNQQDLLTSFELVIAGTEKKGTVLTDTEKRIVSYHEVGHALVAALQKHSQPVSKITIVPHTSGALGYTMQMPEEEKFLSSKEELIVELQTMLGGRAAEQIVFGIATTGASNDIERATELARKMVTQYGMSDKLGLMALSTVSNPYLDGSTMMNCADSTSSAADEEIHKLLMDCYEDAKRLLTEHRALLDEIAMYLLTKETITGDEFMTYVNAENKKLTDGSEPAQDEQDAEAPASPDAPQEDAPSASD